MAVHLFKAVGHTPHHGNEDRSEVSEVPLNNDNIF